MSLTKAWIKEKRKHLGDYGDSSEHDIQSAFKAGWMAHVAQMIYIRKTETKRGRE